MRLSTPIWVRRSCGHSDFESCSRKLQWQEVRGEDFAYEERGANLKAHKGQSLPRQILPSAKSKKYKPSAKAKKSPLPFDSGEICNPRPQTLAGRSPAEPVPSTVPVDRRRDAPRQGKDRRL